MKISAISAITNIGVSAYQQKCHIGTPLVLLFYSVYMYFIRLGLII